MWKLEIFILAKDRRAQMLITRFINLAAIIVQGTMAEMLQVPDSPAA
jgi:hypothetical protein